MIRYNTVKTETILSFNSYDKIVFCDLLKNNLDNMRLVILISPNTTRLRLICGKKD